jgi:SAM-dependent methyltransferase
MNSDTGGNQLMQYSQMAPYYDKLYSFKDYRDELKVLQEIIRSYLENDLTTLLDVACGTGKHLEVLKDNYNCEGLDICPDLLDIAIQRNPGLFFHLADMTNFDLSKKYDIITCFFGSIGHILSVENLWKTIRTFKRQLTDRGIIILEPWHTPEQFKAGRTNLLTVDEPDLKIARCCSSRVHGNISVLDMHHLICTPQGTEHFVEHLELGLFEEKDYMDALSEGGFTVKHEKIRSNGNGVYLAFKR